MLKLSVESIDDARQLLANIKKKWLLTLNNANDLDFNYYLYFLSKTWETIIITLRVFNYSQYNTVDFKTLTSLNKQESVNFFLKIAKVSLKLWSSYKLVTEKVVKNLSSHTLTLI